MPYKDGKKWRASVTYKKIRYQAMLPTKKDAIKWEDWKRKELKRNERYRQNAINLIDFCLKYLNYAKRFTNKVYDEKRKLCEMILTEWGSTTYVEAINEEMVLRYLYRQANSRSRNASNKDRKNLSAMFNWGQDILGMTANPVQKIKKLSHERTTQYTPPKEDILKILKIATKEEGVFLNCYLTTAARRSEIFRWKWFEDINFEKRMYRLGTKKTIDGSMEYEWFPMPDRLYESLMWQWNNRKFEDNPYVFICEQPGVQYGKPYKIRRRFLKGLCKKAGVKPFGFHGLRRHVASTLAETHNVSAKTIQRILRHKSLNTTERYIQNINKDLANTLNLLSESYD